MDELILNEIEFRQNLEKLINNSKLPAFVIRQDLGDAYNGICRIEQQQYANAMANRIKKEKGEKNEAK